MRKSQAVTVHRRVSVSQRAVEPPRQQRGHREGERHDEAHVARVEQERVDQHVGDFEEGIEAPPLERGRGSRSNGLATAVS